MARYFNIPFATTGDKDTIPDGVQSDGTVSYTEGYGGDYSRNPESDPQAQRIERNNFNQLFFETTSTLQLYYQTGVPPFITSADKGGSAFSYGQYARCLYDPGGGARIYESLVANNTAIPSNALNWRLADFDGLDARYLLKDSNLLDIPNKPLAISNLGIMGYIDNIGTNEDGSFIVFSNNFMLMSVTASVSASSTEVFDLPIAYGNGQTFRGVSSFSIPAEGTINISSTSLTTYTLQNTFTGQQTVNSLIMIT